MWDQERKRRFQELRTRELQGPLAEAEQTELLGMIRDLEAKEAAYLRPAKQRLERRNIQLAAQNTALKRLVEREMRLHRYLQRVLKKVDAERHAISTELADILEASSVMLGHEEVTSKIHLLDIVPGEPASILIAQRATRPDGKQRTITQKVRVPDSTLFSRLCATANKGDQIEITVVTE